MVTPLIVKYNLSATVATVRLTRPAISLKYLASLLSGTIPRPISLVTKITVFPSLDAIKFSNDSNSDSDKVIEAGDFVTFDFGAVYKGYHSDMTRTIVMGPASELQKKLYSIVLEAQKRGVAAVKAGITGKELDAVCRDYIKEYGYTKEFNHGTGHGVGLEIHEEPVANTKSDTVFTENMIITVEPGIYITGTIGLRIEDSVIVKSDGYEVLTHSPKELIEIGI